MEEIEELDQWLKNFNIEPVQFMATFDPETGAVTAVGPSHAFVNNKYKIEMDQEIAEMIIEGKITLDSCSVDITGDTVTILETRAMFKIDDVLHRIVEIDHADFEKPNVFLTYENNSLTLELTEEYGGTKLLPEKFQPVKRKKINWAGSTDMNFLITDYNDPNVLYKVFSIKIMDLIDNKITLKNLELPEKFSVYTRRLFKNYVLERI
jgi:hypothetical protein